MPVFVVAIAALVLPSIGQTPTLVKSNAQCGSADTSLGNQNNLAACASACSSTSNCNFFAYGEQSNACRMELTASPRCPQGYELSSQVSFYEIQRGGAGCTNELAHNFRPDATSDDGSCTAISACTGQPGPCVQCADCCQCQPDGGNLGYRNRQNDTIYASRVADGAITIDGDLRDWAGHEKSRCYQDVAFADRNGEEVVFESFGSGKWFGRDDFSVRFMLRWDSRHLYLAAEATDDDLQAGATCYANGLQAAFEVGGENSPDGAGGLQRRRSEDATISRLQLLNLGLRARPLEGGRLEHGGACSTKLPDAEACCVDYELSQHGGFARKTHAAVLRNEITRVTAFEVAFAIEDLVGNDLAGVPNESTPTWPRWKEGLEFGFSFLINDGDNSTDQQGWAGYYPHSIVYGFNGGQKEPAKVGVLQLAGIDTDAAGRSASAGDASGGSFSGGMFVFGLFVGCALPPLWLTFGRSLSFRAPELLQSALQALGVLGLFLLGVFIGSGGAAMSFGWGFVTGAVLGISSFTAYSKAKSDGGGVAINPVAPRRTTTKPLAAADQSSASSFTPPVVAPIGGPIGGAIMIDPMVGGHDMSK